MQRKILAVDDEEHALKILCMHLENAGYAVVRAADGEEAIAMVEKHPDIECILLDRMMPKLDGIQVLQRLKGPSGKHRHIPIVLQTAKREDWDSYEGIESGAIAYITKPYTRETLLATVETILRDMDAMKARFANKA